MGIPAHPLHLLSFHVKLKEKLVYETNTNNKLNLKKEKKNKQQIAIRTIDRNQIDGETLRLVLHTISLMQRNQKKK